jgi:hypothetical protein
MVGGGSVIIDGESLNTNAFSELFSNCRVEYCAVA